MDIDGDGGRREFGLRGQAAEQKVIREPPQIRSPDIKGPEEGQPFTYDLFVALRPSEFERLGSWFAESSEPPNCCWAYGITPQFRRDSIRRDPSTA